MYQPTLSQFDARAYAPSRARQGSTAVADAGRLPLLDVLRGVAVLGILLMVIPYFALPDYYSDAFRSNPSDPNFWLRAAITVGVEGKMRALFGMLFGAGILLFTLRREEQSRRPVTGLFYRRMGWLLVVGLLHAHVLLWPADILYLYALCGMLLYPLRKLPPRSLLWLALLALASDSVVGTIYFRMTRDTHLAYVAAAKARDLGTTLTPDQTKALLQWRQMERAMWPSRSDAVENTRKMKGDYASVAGRVRPVAIMRQSRLLPSMLFDSLSMMLLGMALFKGGFLRGSCPRRVYRWVASLGYGIGLPLVLYKLYFDTSHLPNLEARLAFLDANTVDWTKFLAMAQRVCIGLAHVAAIILLFGGGSFPGLQRRLAAVGKMAFTNYLAYTVICSLLFFGYGLNLYAELKYLQVYGVAVAIWVLLLAVCPWWMQRFRFGPLEWVWRVLTHWRVPHTRA